MASLFSMAMPAAVETTICSFGEAVGKQFGSHGYFKVRSNEPVLDFFPRPRSFAQKR